MNLNLSWIAMVVVVHWERTRTKKAKMKDHEDLNSPSGVTPKKFGGTQWRTQRVTFGIRGLPAPAS